MSLDHKEAKIDCELEKVMVKVLQKAQRKMKLKGKFIVVQKD